MRRFWPAVCTSPLDLPGLAYLTGRVIDRGTEHRSADVIAEELDERGISLRVGTTRHTMTLSCTCLAEDFSEVLAIVMDVARRPAFPDRELAKRRAEAITAVRQDEDNPAVRAVVGLSELLYGEDHPYGRRAKGTVDSLERIDREAIVGFHRRYVRPAVLTLAVVGDVGAQDVIDRTAAELDGWTGAPAGSIVVPPPLVPAGPADARDSHAGEVADGYRVRIHHDQPPRSAVLRVLDDEQHPRAVRPRRPAGRQHPRTSGDGVLRVQHVRSDRSATGRWWCVPESIRRTWTVRSRPSTTEVRQLGAEGPTPVEVAETREFLIGSIPRLLETNYSIASFLQTCEQFGLGLDYDRRLPALLEAVTIDEIRSAASEVLMPRARRVVVAGPVVRPDEAEP